MGDVSLASLAPAMRFEPPFCPDSACPTRASAAFRWRRDGLFRRRCDARRVQRFRCLVCGRRFSAQTFRLDFRQHRPRLNGAIFGALVSKVNHRQTARMLRTNRKTVERRVRAWGPALREYHGCMLERARRRSGLHGPWTLDELETYEHDRRLQPVTLPILLHWRYSFILHAETAPLPARGRLSALDRKRKIARERQHGPRRSGSNEAVARCFAAWRRVHGGGPAELVTDRKSSYPRLFRSCFGAERGAHLRVSSQEPRNRRNPLFTINHNLAMLREHVSRLARRTWAASKLRQRLDCHLWIWIAWRNYLRGITNRAKRTTPAMAIGLDDKPRSVRRILRWRWPSAMPYDSI